MNKSKIAQKMKNEQQVSCQRKQKNSRIEYRFSGNVQRKYKYYYCIQRNDVV